MASTRHWNRNKQTISSLAWLRTIFGTFKGATWGRYRPRLRSQRIQADHLAAELGLPEPSQDFGRSCLKAAARLLRKDEPFPTNYQEDWENAARRLLAQLAREATSRGA